ncbi:rhomboid family intramembrane serine protease [Sphingomonas sp. NSE70-1]|uniref:Rhomboid family intramembrane serine protease n=1 Tax=Sphingomonas caseinilyticus TaxID=2908205 RepID=A0ABT0RRC9_9SPHN|nr:rhomboid family intramembrane serine protease [Sphingomonas caseinilyticus]MCL6697562.1 rhomboid family intramembrane serine protease [Sphingomonas caseinilyticus]
MRSATAIIAIVTVAVSAIAIFWGVDYSAVFAGFIPARISGVVQLAGALPAWITPFSSALVHGGWLHLGVNMLMLVFAGSMVERVIGGTGLLFAYVIGALVAAFSQFIVDPGSPIPMVGASGAISALFGLYALFFGAPKQVTRNQKLNRWLHVAWLLVAWVVLQWMAGYLAGGGGVMLATPAHIGGFIAGLLLQRPLLLWRYRKA